MKKVILLSLALAAGISAWGQTFSGGTGTESDPYKITKAEDFTELATQVNDNAVSFTGKYFALENDITIPSTFTYTPIGKWVSYSVQNKFDGVFDGKNHTITDLVLSTQTGDRYSGLFAVVDTAGVIKNLNLANPKVTVDAGTSVSGGTIVGQLAGTVDNVHVKGGSYTSSISGFKGGLVGHVLGGGYVLNSSYSGSMTNVNTFAAIVGQLYGVVRNCWSDATLTAQIESQTYTGGIVGVALGSMAGAGNPQVEISDCYFYGTISSVSGNCGGIVANASKVVMERCWNAGYIQSGNYTGGIAGQITDTSLKDSYNTGTVYNQSSSSVGGIVGYLSGSSSSLENCLSLGTIFNSIIARNDGCEFIGDNKASITPVNCYFDSQVAGWGGTLGSKTTKELTGGSAISGFSTDVWTFGQGMYPRLKKTATLDLALLNATPFYLADGESHGRVTKNFTVSTLNDVEWEITGTTQARLSGSNVTVTRGTTLSNAVLHAYLGDYEKRSLVSIYPQIFSGEGTADDPYIIASFDDMKKLSDATNNQSMSFAGEYFKMTADIDMQNDASFPIISDASLGAFAGVFDGQGHSIKNWKFDNSETEDLWSGLFSFVAKDGVIKNLNIDKSCSLRFNRNGAAFVSALQGTLENCRNYADVYSAKGFAGGLVYIAYSGSKVADCYNEGNVTASAQGYLGGIIYSVESGVTVSNCQNAGRVTAAGTATTVGGLFGSCAGEVTDALNTGDVSAATAVGGITGQAKAAKMTNVLSLGVVSSTGDESLSGAVVGKLSSASTFSNVCFDNQVVLGNNVVAEGLYGTNTKSLLSSTVFSNGRWVIANTETYPQLTSFKDEEGAKLGSCPVTFADNDTRQQVSGTALLGSMQGIVWKLSKGTDFSIADSSLKYAESDHPASDTLTATYGSHYKVIPIAAVGKILPGSGTASDPYIIASPSDLVKVSSVVASTKNGFPDKVFSIVADLDMQGIDFQPIGSASTVKFNATINGNKHAISNLTINKPSDSYVGLVGILGTGGNINNLTIKSGSVVGTSIVGAFVGESEGKLNDLANYASVTATAKAGGIAGSIIASTGLSFNKLYNYGDVSATGASGYAGGITSHFSGVPNASVGYSANYGTVNSTKSVAGGIVGYVEHGAELNFSNNYGAINAYGPAGGIVGQNTISYSDDKTVRFTVNACLNVANVTTSYNAAGGIVGDIDSEAGQTYVYSSANTGNVSNTKESISAYSAGAAGIVGKGNPVLQDVYNSGNISGNNSIAGILGLPGSNYSKHSIFRAVSTGSLSGYASNAANIGAIACKKSNYLTIDSVAYDAQQCNVPAVANADMDGVSALKTSDLVHSYKLNDNAWACSDGEYFTPGACYPMIKALREDSALIAASIPVYLDSADTRYNVTKTITVARPQGAEWTVPDAFYYTGYYVAAKPGTVGDYSLTVNYGKYSRTYDLYVNAPEGTGVKDAIAANVQIRTVAGGIVVPEGGYAVYTMGGSLVKAGSAAAGDFIGLSAGVYVVKAGSAVAKVIVR